MSVILHEDMPIDQALKMLWREANREKLPDQVQKNRFRSRRSKTYSSSEKIYTNRHSLTRTKVTTIIL